ncbi:MAG: hypothetical protein ACLUFI_15240 [Oscillospiraceae bacterium]
MVQTIYFVADDPRGPWRSPMTQGLDGRRFYAAKSCAGDDGRRIFFGWSHERIGDSDEGGWQWGGDFNVPREASAAERRFGVRPIPEAMQAFDQKLDTSFKGCSATGKRGGKDAVTCEAIGTFGYGFFDLTEEAAEKDMLFTCRILAQRWSATTSACCSSRTRIWKAATPCASSRDATASAC